MQFRVFRDRILPPADKWVSVVGAQKEKLLVEPSKLEAQLRNPQFVERATAEKVAEIRARIADIAHRTAQFDQSIESLG